MRLGNILREVEENEDIVLVIDEIHTLVGAGGASPAPPVHQGASPPVRVKGAKVNRWNNKCQTPHCVVATHSHTE